MATVVLPKSGIYAIRNVVSGRIYVGSAIHLRARWQGHLYHLRRGSHHSVKLQRSWTKHGQDAFEFSILEHVERVEDLLQREQIWIDKLSATCPRHGFNVYPIAGSPLGTKASLATRAKMSEMRRGKKMPPRSEEHRARISESKRGTKASEETRAKLSALHKGRRKGLPLTAEHRKKLSASWIGRKAPERSPELAAKMRAILTERNKSAKMRSISGAKFRAINAARRSASPDQFSLFPSG